MCLADRQVVLESFHWVVLEKLATLTLHEKQVRSQKRVKLAASSVSSAHSLRTRLSGPFKQKQHHLFFFFVLFRVAGEHPGEDPPAHRAGGDGRVHFQVLHHASEVCNVTLRAGGCSGAAVWI